MLGLLRRRRLLLNNVAAATTKPCTGSELMTAGWTVIHLNLFDQAASSAACLRELEKSANQFCHNRFLNVKSILRFVDHDRVFSVYHLICDDHISSDR